MEAVNGVTFTDAETPLEQFPGHRVAGQEDVDGAGVYGVNRDVGDRRTPHWGVNGGRIRHRVFVILFLGRGRVGGLGARLGG
jgi:hypothetical protein